MTRHALLGMLAASLAASAVAAELQPLEVRHLRSDTEMRFVTADEWKYLGSFTDCPDQDASGNGPAKHPAILVKQKEVHVTVAGETRIVKPALPEGATHPDPPREWVVRKVVCGSRGYAVLYSDAYASGRKFLIARFDHRWHPAQADIFTLPEMKFAGFPGGTHGRSVWRFAEAPEGFALTILDLAGNKDSTFSRASYVALAQHEFLVVRAAQTAGGFADRPGPLLTRAYLEGVPVQIMPGAAVPRDVQQHDVVLGDWTGAAKVHVDVADHPVFLRLRAHRPVEWRITRAEGTRLVAIHLWGPPPQTVSGVAPEVLQLRFDAQGGTKGESQALFRLGSLAGQARSEQTIPVHQMQDVIVVDGRAGAKAPRRNIRYPDLSPDVPEAIAARIANCPIFKDQDERIECYRLRADVLFGRWR